MQPRSDKEFDNVFRQGLEDLAVEPSPAVWRKIEERAGKSAKPSGGRPAIYWMVAASLAVAVSAAILFQSPQNVIRLQGTAGVSEVADPIREIRITRAPGAGPVRRTDEPLPVTIPVPVSAVETIEEPVVEKTVYQAVTQVAVSKKVDVPGSEPKVEPIVSPPGEEVMLAGLSEVMDNHSDEVSQSGPRKIRSIGGLVNFVISKVDRREDKLIEFIDGEEGTEVSGINLGLLKLKKNNN